MGTGRMHSGGRRIGHQAARRGAWETPDKGARAGAVVPVHSEGIWRGGGWAPPQRAGGEGNWGKNAPRALAEYARGGRRPHADPTRPRPPPPKKKKPQTAF